VALVLDPVALLRIARRRGSEEEGLGDRARAAAGDAEYDSHSDCERPAATGDERLSD
jgi:hypothetical protein